MCVCVCVCVCVKHLKVSAVKNKYYIKNTAAAGVYGGIFREVVANICIISVKIITFKTLNLYYEIL